MVLFWNSPKKKTPATTPAGFWARKSLNLGQAEEKRNHFYKRWWADKCTERGTPASHTKICHGIILIVRYCCAVFAPNTVRAISIIHFFSLFLFQNPSHFFLSLSPTELRERSLNTHTHWIWSSRNSQGESDSSVAGEFDWFPIRSMEAAIIASAFPFRSEFFFLRFCNCFLNLSSHPAQVYHWFLMRRRNRSEIIIFMLNNFECRLLCVDLVFYSPETDAFLLNS